MRTAQETFRLLLSEATFTKDVLGSGATQIRKANYAAKGLYAQSFASLSIGLERIGKLCLILDYYIDNNGTFPDFSHLKNKIGHKIMLLHERGAEIAQRRNMQFSYLSVLNHPLHLSILHILNDYALGDRYSNINVLAGARQQNDPIAAWFTNVDLYIFNNMVTARCKQVIERNAAYVAHQFGDSSTVYHTAETGDLITDLGEASYRTGVFESVAAYRQLFVLQVIRYWVELLRDLGCQAQHLGHLDVPFFGELFCGFNNPDTYLRSRKTWNF